MSGRYAIPARTTRVDDEVKKSRFITTLAYAPTVEHARAFVQSIRDEFPDATHNCWAYVVGPPRSTDRSSASDDGEPGGTAGRPMLAVLLGSGVGDIAAVVTRYFGGTKLGRGGLVRAYSHGVLHALRELERAERVPRVRLEVVVPYAAVDAVRRAFAAHEGSVEAEGYGEEAGFTVVVPADGAAALVSALRDATGGAVRIGEAEDLE